VKFRRSLYFVKDLQPGDVVTPLHVRSVRPGYGAAPKHLDSVLGKKVKCAISAASPVNLDDLE
jgi:sialic acid synthase SpsE